jgi:hypothetical protein
MQYDEVAPSWWIASGWADLLVEQVTDDRGPAARAARDRIGLALLLSTAVGAQRPGLATARQALADAGDDGLGDRLDQHVPGWRGHATFELNLSRAVLAAVTAAYGRDERPVEQLFTAGVLLACGGGGPAW